MRRGSAAGDFVGNGALMRGVSERAVFVIDPRGTIFWRYRSPIGVNPGADGILRALDEMTKRKATA